MAGNNDGGTSVSYFLCVKSLALWEEKEIRFWMYTMQKNEPILKSRALCSKKSYLPTITIETEEVPYLLTY